MITLSLIEQTVVTLQDKAAVCSRGVRAACRVDSYGRVELMEYQDESRQLYALASEWLDVLHTGQEAIDKYWAEFTADANAEAFGEQFR